MLKKFFIGLIILSALATEGGAVFQAEYCSLLLYAQSQPYVLGNSNESLTSNTVNKSSTYSLKDILSFSSLRLSFSKEQLKYKYAFYDFNEPSYKFDLMLNFTEVNERYAFIYSQEPVVEGTDSSPPGYINYI